MDAMSPFEVASGCDIVEIGGSIPIWPCSAESTSGCWLTGGRRSTDISNASPGDARARRPHPHLRPRRSRGGAVPEHLHYRKRCVELGG